MSEPLTLPDVDLRGLPFMPLHGEKLMDSDLFMISTGDEFKAALTLWWASWKQIPAASLPTDDRLLAGLARVDRKAWTKLKEVALRGWVLCSDGRLYHPTVAQLANEAWAGRQSQRSRTAAARAAKAAVAASVTETVTAPVTEPVTASKGQGEGQLYVEASASYVGAAAETEG